MTRNEIARVQAYLRRTFDNNRIAVDVPAKATGTVEIRIGDEFIGVLHRDEDEGEVSYAVNISILEEDLLPADAFGNGD
ncbi:MAG: DUF3126 family protein [Proteobacteria bacterium]|nr:DUF3126 family protein [Pseudomonadota bacterium]